MLATLKAYLAPYRLWIELAVVAILTAAFLWYRHSLIQEGVKQQQDADAKVVAATIIHNAEVESRAKTLAEVQLAAYKATVSAPPSPDAPRLKCVPDRPRTRPVPQDARPRSGDHAAVPPPAVVQGPGEDLGSELDTKLRDADALILALQQRIQAEIGVCR